MRSGAAYLVTDDLQLDVSASASVYKTPALFYGGIGFSWRYDANYNEVKIPIEDPNVVKAQKRAKKGTKKKKFLIF